MVTLKCPICNQRSFLDGNAVDSEEYIDTLIKEISKSTSKYTKYVEEIDNYDEKYSKLNSKYNKIKANYSKMTEYIALKMLEENEENEFDNSVL